MIIRGMNLPLIIACIVIVLALIILPLIVSYKAEKKEKNNINAVSYTHLRAHETR